MPGGGGREALVADVVQRVRAGGLSLSVRVTSYDGRGAGQEQPALPRTPLNNLQALAGAFAGIVFDHLG
jgi:hypothetical protein